MKVLFHDKVFAVAVAASATVHLAVFSGVPSFRISREDTRQETYIEFIYYQIQAGQDGLDKTAAIDERSEPVKVEAEAVEVRDVHHLLQKEHETEEESVPHLPDRKINVRVRDETGTSPLFKDAGMFEEGKLLNEYARTLDRIIESYGCISYPSHQRRRFIDGSVLIYFRVRRNGSLKFATARKGAYSNCPEFRAAALDAVRRASAHFPPFPEGLKREEILFSLPVSFTLER
ncbi:MAG: TonB family protein [Candidatus Tritonobacter lacicola]|nr:TonB family protein [Candidatus Tritonobacter lacicola]